MIFSRRYGLQIPKDSVSYFLLRFCHAFSEFFGAGYEVFVIRQEEIPPPCGPPPLLRGARGDLLKELNNAAGHSAACFQQIVGFVDLFERKRLRDQLVDLDLFVHIHVEQAGHVDAGAGRTVE